MTLENILVSIWLAGIAIAIIGTLFYKGFTKRDFSDTGSGGDEFLYPTLLAAFWPAIIGLGLAFCVFMAPFYGIYWAGRLIRKIVDVRNAGRS